MGNVTALETRHRHESGSHGRSFEQFFKRRLRQFPRHFLQRRVLFVGQQHEQRVVGVLKRTRVIRLRNMIENLKTLRLARLTPRWNWVRF